MKMIISFVAVLFTAVGANAGVNCFGVQDSKGLRGSLEQVDQGIFTLAYIDAGSITHSCRFFLDKNYKPRSPDARQDRYLVESIENCEKIDLAMVSKSLFKEGKGFVDVVYQCPGGGGCAHGEPGDVHSFLCKVP